MEKEEEDRRREEAIASTPCLQPNFNPRRNGVTKDQLAKFQELHKRRLQIKSKSKIKTKFKDGTNRFHGSDLKIQDSGAEVLSVDNKEPSLLGCDGFDSRNESSLEQDNASVDFAPKKRQKLHWGLDTKERWERKSNM